LKILAVGFSGVVSPRGFLALKQALFKLPACYKKNIKKQNSLKIVPFRYNLCKLMF